MPRPYYSFGASPTPGPYSKEVLGGKGAGLIEMSANGFPVPPGFVIPTSWCVDAQSRGLGAVLAELAPHVKEALAALESEIGYVPLVSVRSGARVSMPGMMDTVLNVGAIPEVLDGLPIGPRAKADSERRFLQMYGSVVGRIPHEKFEAILTVARQEAGVALDSELPEVALRAVVAGYRALYAEAGVEIPSTYLIQVMACVRAVFESWENPRAIEYRRLHSIPSDWGTAVVVQAMVYGNLNEKSGSGVLFTRDPGDGHAEIVGEYLVNAQGEDVVAGIRTPKPLGEMAFEWPAVSDELSDLAVKLEQHYRDMQDIEFTVQDGKLYILQTRAGKRTGLAAIVIARALELGGLISVPEALKRVSPEQYLAAIKPVIDPKWAVEPSFSGIPAGPGIAVGRAVYSAADAVAASGPVILVTRETDPDDIAGMAVAVGILTATGGATSHAAVVARGFNKPCVVGAEGVQALVDGRPETSVAIDGATGRVWIGQVPAVVEAASHLDVRWFAERIMEGRATPRGSWENPGAGYYYLADRAEELTALDTRLGRLRGELKRVFGEERGAGKVLDLGSPTEFEPEADAGLLDALCSKAFRDAAFQELVARVVSCLVAEQAALRDLTVVVRPGSDEAQNLQKAGFKLARSAARVGDLAEGGEFKVSAKFVNEIMGGPEALEKIAEIFRAAGKPLSFYGEARDVREVIWDVCGG